MNNLVENINKFFPDKSLHSVLRAGLWITTFVMVYALFFGIVPFSITSALLFLIFLSASIILFFSALTVHDEVDAKNKEMAELRAKHEKFQSESHAFLQKLLVFTETEDFDKRLGAQVAVYVKMGDIAQMRNDFQNAKDLYLKALHIAEDFEIHENSVVAQTVVYKKLSLLHKKLGDFEQAKDYWRKSAQVGEGKKETDSLTDKSKSTKKTKSYSRNFNIEPRLIWTDKEGYGGQGLKVALMPIQVQATIHPKALLTATRARCKNGQSDAVNALFGQLAHEQTIEYYKYSQWQNRLILGNAVQVMTALAEIEGLKALVQMIYIDASQDIDFTANLSENQGISSLIVSEESEVHLYLSHLWDKLTVAKELLSESGSIFIHVRAENLHWVRSLMEEMLGRDNFVTVITFNAEFTENTDYLDKVSDYVIWYAKSYKNLKYNQLFFEKVLDEQYFDKVDEYGRAYHSQDLLSQGEGNTEKFDFKDKKFSPPEGYYWQIPPQALPTHRIEIDGNFIKARIYFSDFPLQVINNIWNDKKFIKNEEDTKSISAKVIQRCLLMSTEPNDLIFIPNCQLGEVVHAAEHWGRRWIACETSLLDFTLSSIRLSVAHYPHYLLADSKKGIEKQSVIEDTKIPINMDYDDNPEKGFVYKHIPYITLESIANNADIDEIQKKWAKKLKSLKKQLDKLTARKWKIWNIPTKAPLHWQPKAKETLENWWQLQRDYEQEIDNLIEKNAIKKKRYDQPYVDEKLTRITSPFTLEKVFAKTEKNGFLMPFKVNISTNSAGKLKARKDGKYQINILSIETPDSNTNNANQNNLNAIVCWFVDDNYDGENFMPQHIYFTGNSIVYEKLNTVMEMKIAESSWSKIGTTKSYPFPAPKTGKVAVKVINQHNEEVLVVLHT